MKSLKDILFQCGSVCLCLFDISLSIELISHIRVDHNFVHFVRFVAWVQTICTSRPTLNSLNLRKSISYIFFWIKVQILVWNSLDDPFEFVLVRVYAFEFEVVVIFDALPFNYSYCLIRLSCNTYQITSLQKVIENLFTFCYFINK